MAALSAAVAFAPAQEIKKQILENKEKAEQIPAPKQFKVAKYLLDVSVTVRAGWSSGSGVMVHTSDGRTWVWTAGHVVDGLRSTREVISDKGGKKTIVEFEDAQIMRFYKDKDTGRIVSRYASDAEVIRYSGFDYGNDLALLRMRDKSFKPNDSARFYLEDDLADIGSNLYHCGSLLGPFGFNSLTDGIMSQHGRVLDKRMYDQTTTTAFPGSSGGIVCLKKDGRYVGMLTMGAGEGFNLIVPTRRIRNWAKEVGVEFAVNPTIKPPDEKTLRSKPIDASGSISTGHGWAKQHRAVGLKFMVYDKRDPLAKANRLKDWYKRPGFRFAPELIHAPMLRPEVLGGP